MSYITYKQADSRWGKKNYNGSSNMANAGCGPSAVAMLAYAVDGKTTPWDVAKFMQKNGYAIRNNGTAWAGIPAAMKHYGLKDVRNVAKMDDIFALLDKGYCAVFLFRAGSRGGVCWTTAGHYIAVTDYKVKNGKHYLYTRDSGGRNHTGWYCYETQMKGLIPQVWCGYVPGMLKSGQTKKKATPKAIDVSDHQGKINWKKVKAAGIKYVIIRAGFGKGNIDGCFIENIKGAIAAGIEHIGIYWFMYSYTEEMATNEGHYCVKAIEPYREHIDMFVSADWEYASMNYANEKGKNPSKSLITKMNKAFCEVVKAAGYTPAVYYNYDYKKNHMDLSKLPYLNWYALDDSNGKFKSVAIQQYGTTKIDGIGEKVDINWIHDTSFIKAPAKVETPTPATTTTTPEKKAYPGTIPSTKLVKTNAEVIADCIKFLKWIAGDNDFHYGHGEGAHHNGCYFCGTQKLKKGHGIVDPEHTYCCNPLIGAAWAHGGCVPQALKMCRGCSSWDFHKGHGYDKSALFDNLKHPKKKDLKPGDVLCRDTHVAEYIGDGKLAEASGGDDNKKGSKKWDNSIHIVELTDGRYDNFPRVHRFNGSVNTTCNICHGEVGKRVEQLQSFLKWYGYDIKVDGLFGDSTLKAVKKFQKASGIKDDGVVGPNTIKAMKAARR